MIFPGCIFAHLLNVYFSTGYAEKGGAVSAEGRKMSRKFTVRIDCMEDIHFKNQ